jgi:hypothetical protein
MSRSRRFMNVALAIGVLCGFSAPRSRDASSQSETKARPTRGPDRRMSDEQIVKDLRSALSELVAQDRFSGTVLLAKGDRVLFEQPYGFADHAFNVPNKVDTKFNFRLDGKNVHRRGDLAACPAGQVLPQRRASQGRAGLSEQGGREQDHPPSTPDPHVRLGRFLRQGFSRHSKG